MYKIQANASGTRSIEITDSHLETIKKYILDKLKFNVRGLLESEPGKDKDLLDLCLDVIYNQNMKAIGLKNLVALFKEWVLTHQDAEEEDNEVL